MLEAARLKRREFLRIGVPVLATLSPLGGLSLLTGCGKRAPETPLAHLYGQKWVDGAYHHYADVYVQVEQRAQTKSYESYRLLAQHGVNSLANLQAREVPFFIRVSSDDQNFRVERDLPERLTFTAGMSQAERDLSTRNWKLAQEHIHADYQEVRRLDLALSNLLGQVQALRIAADEGGIEQYRICRQLLELAEGGELPFELPYQVSRADYARVLELLVLRLERDRERLRALESAMVVVGLTARATDAGSGSLSGNLNRALLAVVKDAEALEASSTSYPVGAALAADLQAAKRLVHSIQQSPAFQAWLAAQREAEDALGKLLVILDSATGLPTSAIYRQVMRMWRGDADYLDYLSAALSLLPGGSQAISVVKSAVDRTREYRDTYAKAVRLVGNAQDVKQRLARGELDPGGVLLNTGSGYARDRLHSQLVFLQDQAELADVKRELAELDAFAGLLPEVPAELPGAPEPLPGALPAPPPDAPSPEPTD